MSFKLSQYVTITKLLCCFTVQTHAKLNNFNSESDPWPISDCSKNFLIITSQCLRYRLVEYAVKGTDVECTTIECVLPWVMRNWVGCICKKFGVVGYTSSDIDLGCTTTGYTRPISLPVYTSAVYASSDYESCVHSHWVRQQWDWSWVHNHWEHRVFCLGYRLVRYASTLHSFLVH